MATVFRFEDGVFKQKVGDLRQISAGNEETVWGVNDSSTACVWDRDANEFVLLATFLPPSPLFDLVRATESGGVWALDARTKKLCFRDPAEPARGFVTVDVQGQQFRNVVAGDQFAFAITGALTYMIESSGTFKRFDLPLQTISCGGPDSNPWGLDALGGVFFFDGGTGDFRQLEGITFDKISVGGTFPIRNELQTWGLKRKDDIGPIVLHDIFHAVKNDSNPDLFEFHQVDGELMTVFAGNAEDTSVWGINAFHEIFQFDGNGFVRRDDRQQWMGVSVGRNAVWALASA